MAAIDFLKRQAAYAATRLQRNRTATNTYSGTGSYERIINGWALGTMRSWSEDTEYFSNVHTDYEQQQHKMVLVLGTDGNLYSYTETAHEFGAARKGGARTEHSSTVFDVNPPDFSAPHYLSIKKAIEIVQALGRK